MALIGCKWSRPTKVNRKGRLSILLDGCLDKRQCFAEFTHVSYEKLDVFYFVCPTAAAELAGLGGDGADGLNVCLQDCTRPSDCLSTPGLTYLPVPTVRRRVIPGRKSMTRPSQSLDLWPEVIRGISDDWNKLSNFSWVPMLSLCIVLDEPFSNDSVWRDLIPFHLA